MFFAFMFTPFNRRVAWSANRKETSNALAADDLR